MDSGVEIGLIVGIGTVISAVSPIIHAIIANKQRQREREEDRADRLMVARKADAAAQQATKDTALLHGATQEVAKMTEVGIIATEQNAARLDSISAQSEQIRGLVNGNLAEAKQQCLDQARLTLVAMRRMIQMTQDLGHRASAEDLATVKATEARIAELEAELDYREKQSASPPGRSQR